MGLYRKNYRMTVMGCFLQTFEPAWIFTLLYFGRYLGFLFFSFFSQHTLFPCFPLTVKNIFGKCSIFEQNSFEAHLFYHSGPSDSSWHPSCRVSGTPPPWWCSWPSCRSPRGLPSSWRTPCTRPGSTGGAGGRGGVLLWMWTLWPRRWLLAESALNHTRS